MDNIENVDKRVPVLEESLSIIRDNSKCILCGSCKGTCKFSQGVYGFYDPKNPICIDCGQCTQVCPTGSLDIINDYKRVKKEIEKGKIVIFQTSPSVRTSLAEQFELDDCHTVERKIVSALKKLGARYVFDTTFGADLTIMEEATELVNRIKNNENIPMFTSCCPAWVKFVEIFYPKYIRNLSSVKSPIMMQGTIIKTYFAEKNNINPSDIINVALTPCTAKKAEINREEMTDSSKYYNVDMKDVDYIITVKEFIKWLEEEKIEFTQLDEVNYDKFMPSGTGASYLFGNSGGVMEAALRTAYYMLTGDSIPSNLIELNEIRGTNGIKEATIKIGDKDLKIAVISGTMQARKFLDKLDENNYDFIEVMACPGGCIAGGGQPKRDPMEMEDFKRKRSDILYNIDRKDDIKNSYENLHIKSLYDDFLGSPNSKLAHNLLHTTYKAKDNLLEKKEETPN